jgi:hypothetical protein
MSGGSEVDSQYISSNMSSATPMNRSAMLSHTGSLDSRGTFNTAERRFSLLFQESSSPSATADLGFRSPSGSNDLKSPASSLRGKMSRLQSFDNSDSSPMQSPMAVLGPGRKRGLLLAQAAAGVVSLKERELLKPPHSHESRVDDNDDQHKPRAENTTAGLEEDSQQELNQQCASSGAKGGTDPSEQPLGGQSQDAKTSLSGKGIEELDDNEEEEEEEEDCTMDLPLPIVRQQQSGIGWSISHSTANAGSVESNETFEISVDSSLPSIFSRENSRALDSSTGYQSPPVSPLRGPTSRPYSTVTNSGTNEEI